MLSAPQRQRQRLCLRWMLVCYHSDRLQQRVLTAVPEQGNINIIDAALRKGVKKFILVTSIGVGDSKDAPPKQVSCQPS